MTIAQDTTDALSRIDHALGVQDAMPDLDGAGWIPGDPLYSRMRGESVGHAAPMIDVREDRLDVLGEWAPGHQGAGLGPRPWSPRCEPCEVSWAGPGPCWVCGEGRAPRPALSEGLGDRIVFMGFDGVVHDISPMVTSWSPSPDSRPASDAPGPARYYANRVLTEPAARPVEPPHLWRLREAVDRAHVAFRPLADYLSAAGEAISRLLGPIVQPSPPSRPRPLCVDGHEYRRRARSRRGRSRR